MARPVFSNISERTRSPRFQGALFARYLAVADRLKAVAADKNITLLIHPRCAAECGRHKIKLS